MTERISIFTVHDAAAEFMHELEASRRPWKLVEKALQEILPDQQFVEVDQAAQALVGAEVVASACGWPHVNFPPEFLVRQLLRSSGDFVALSDIALQAVKWLLVTENNELLQPTSSELVDPLQLEIQDLANRLERSPNPTVIGTVGPEKRIKPQTGDVFQIPLENGKVAYGRLYEQGYFYVYAAIQNVSAAPPFGSREFIFYAGVHVRLKRLIGTEICKIVGRDPLGLDEIHCPPLFNGPGKQTRIYGFVKPFKERMIVTAFQCIGMEMMEHLDLSTLRSRILEDETSVKRSLQHLSPYLSASEVERALGILRGRSCRYFDSDENRAFGLAL